MFRMFGSLNWHLPQIKQNNHHGNLQLTNKIRLLDIILTLLFISSKTIRFGQEDLVISPFLPHLVKEQALANFLLVPNSAWQASIQSYRIQILLGILGQRTKGEKNILYRSLRSPQAQKKLEKRCKYIMIGFKSKDKYINYEVPPSFMIFIGSLQSFLSIIVHKLILNLMTMFSYYLFILTKKMNEGNHKKDVSNNKSFSPQYIGKILRNQFQKRAWVIFCILSFMLLINTKIYLDKQLTHFQKKTTSDGLPDNINIRFRRPYISHVHRAQEVQNQNIPINLVNQLGQNIAQRRMKIGQPVNNKQLVKVWSFVNKAHQNLGFCSTINGLNSISSKTIELAKELFKNGYIYKIIIFTDPNDYNSGQALTKKFGKNWLKYQISYIDSDYQFIRQHTEGCVKMGYLSANFQMEPEMALQFREQINNLREMSMFFSSRLIVKNCQQKLQNLKQVDLQYVKQDEFMKYIYIFDVKLLYLISPLNFAFYARYTMEEILILPILAITQGTENLVTCSDIFHKIEGYLPPAEQYRIHPPLRQSNSMCFISYPSHPYQINLQQFDSYTKSIFQNEKSSIQLSVIVYLPYKFGYTRPLYEVAKYIKTITKQDSFNISRFKLRVMNNKAVSSHAVYDAVYNYCPNQTLVVSSRHNVKFTADFIQEVYGRLNQKEHYYHGNFINSNNQTVLFNKIQSSLPHYAIRKTDFFQKYFRNFQIFKSDFLKTNLFYVLKCEQVDFYQTQSPFVILMLEQIKFKFHYINKTLAYVNFRNETDVEKKQIQNVKGYAQYHPLENNLLMPYLYNVLQNKIYKRFAPDRMPKIIHQVWLSNDKISMIRARLHRTIVQTNKNFEVRLWKFENITAENFPLTYKFIQRIFQFHKTSNVSFFTLAADLIRYQIIYRHGGIYIDFKMQGLKPMDPFLKYEVFFLDADISSLRFLSPKVIGVGIIGGMKNSYYYKMILTELVYQQNIDFKKMIPKMSGAYVARKAFNDQQFFTILGLGYQLFYPLPYELIINACGGVDKTFEPDQQVYIITDYKSKLDLKIGIPCRQYPQSYLVSYPPLAKTWLYQKRNVG